MIREGSSFLKKEEGLREGKQLKKPRKKTLKNLKGKKSIMKERCYTQKISAPELYG